MRCFGRSNGIGASHHEPLMASWGLPLWWRLPSWPLGYPGRPIMTADQPYSLLAEPTTVSPCRRMVVSPGFALGTPFSKTLKGALIS